MKIKLLLSYLAFSACLILLPRCVSEIDLGFPTPADFLVVDGILNFSKDADSSDLVVRLAQSNNTAIRPVGLGKAKMEVIVNNKDAYPLLERETGYYYLFNKNIFKVGDTYKLRFQIGSDNYESTQEILPDSVVMDKAYGEAKAGRTSATATELFVDLTDNPNQKNYYRWAITQWEKQSYCLYCYRQGRSPESCSDDMYAPNGISITRNPPCDGNCYDILRFTPNNSISDVFINGKSLLKKSIGFVPYNFYTPSLIEVKQSSLTPQYFAFLEILRSQAESTGGLADTPAALLVGNVKNLNNPSQKIVGYFSVTNNSVRRIWLDNKQAYNFYKPLSSLNPALDPPVPTPANWLAVACKPSRFRTPLKPWGWQN
jgi:Domain of unknown function (DUF4249)